MMLAALTLVTVGNTEWWFVKRTPAAVKADRFGIRSGVTWDICSPSNTKTITRFICSPPLVAERVTVPPGVGSALECT